MNEQLRVAIEEKRNILLTGPGGAGKSWQLDRLKEEFPHKKIAFTATTGIAATNIGGQTLHSFLNMGMIKSTDINKIVNGIINNKWAIWTQVIEADILVIDEASMLDGFMFEIIEQILRKIRCPINPFEKTDQKPFGGIQVILVGDLFQLPPVQEKDNGFFFSAEAYRLGNFKPIILEKIYRQTDLKFIETLNRIRQCMHNNKDMEYLKQRQFPDINYAKLDTTCLFSTNREADMLNLQRLKTIQEEEVYLDAIDTDFSSQLSLYKKDYSKHFRAPSQLVLKPGCQIILLSNHDVRNNISNGSIGTFLRVGLSGECIYCLFGKKEIKLERKKFEVHEKDKLIYERKQYPIRLGYGITIHSSQGMSLDSVAIDFNRCFASGQGYVAISRARNFDRLYLKNVSSRAFFVNSQVANFMTNLIVDNG